MILQESLMLMERQRQDPNPDHPILLLSSHTMLPRVSHTLAPTANSIENRYNLREVLNEFAHKELKEIKCITRKKNE